MTLNSDSVHPAVAWVGERARVAEPEALARLARRGIDQDRIPSLTRALLMSGRLTLNFHPDRLDGGGRSVAVGLLADGRYRSQFETGISNGGRFAVPGGERVRWERSLFGSVYDGETYARPLYGSLDLFDDSYGGAPRFGSCVVVLAPHCMQRTTFCVGDSHLGARDIGTAACVTSILAGAIEDCADGDGFGRGLSIDSLLQALERSGGQSRSARELDRYIEAQVHGGVDLAADVESIVLDPSFADTETASVIETAALRYGFSVGWNEGSDLDPVDVPEEFRGPDISALARATVRPDGKVDAAVIGQALADIDFTPPSLDGDPEHSPRQRYKKLWHCCVRFGSPTMLEHET